MEKNCLVSFIYAYSFTMVFLVYILKLPTLVTGNTKLVEEYYGQNFNYTFVLDFFLFLIYLSISLFFISYLDIKTFFNKILTVASVTTIISGLFFIYFINTKKTNSFFSRWFHAVSYKAVIYDILLLTFTYTIYQYLYNISKSKTLG
tara:strand:+ start:3674 stop:4114 length:441 start_codon:yes stop_codon:yes gene_type:complete